MKKLFVSSTFKDMQLERDSLQKHIIPDLNMKLSDYGTKIAQTDLRWGISTSQMSADEGEQKVLNVCLDEINKARPYMIVMIGDRYGWQPSTALIETAAKGRGISLASYDISVTQLEIEYIAFSEKWDESRIFFYFRDFDYGNMSADDRSSYECESAEARKKLEELKGRIKKKFPDRIKHYSLKYENGSILGIEHFEKLVTEDLYSLFLSDAEKDERININERVRAKLNYEARETFHIYNQFLDISRDRFSSTVFEKSDLQKTHCYHAGPPRCGKTMSVSSYYTALCAYKDIRDPDHKPTKELFEINNSYFKADGNFSRLPSIIDINNTFPLYLQLGNCKDISTSRDLWRTSLYFLNKHLEIDAKIPEDKQAILNSLVDSLHILKKSNKEFFLFIDDLDSEALGDLFTIEHAFTEEEIPELLHHLHFDITFNNQFAKVPVYVPFYHNSQVFTYKDDTYDYVKYFLAYAKKLGKEISPGVVDYIKGYYGHGPDKYSDADIRQISRTQANLMANYFMNFVSSDYLQIKAAGNDMNAIEAQNLKLLDQLKGTYSDDADGISLNKVALLNVEKFESNHSETTLRMLGIIYLLSGASFSMQEAKHIYSCFGQPWSDLDFVCYFDDFKEFFIYNRDEDSYKVMPMFHFMLKNHFINKHLHGDKDMEDSVERLISAVINSDFYESSKDELFYSALIVPRTEFLLKMLFRLNGSEDFDYDSGKKLGQSIAQMLNTLSVEGSQSLGMAVAPILSKHFSLDAICGFFNGMGLGFQNHEYEKKIIALADALVPMYVLDGDEIGASIALGVHLLGVYCYFGYKNDMAISIIDEAETYVNDACLDLRIRYLSIVSALMRKFDVGSPMFNKLSGLILRYVPEKSYLSYDNEREISISADLFSLAFHINKFSILPDYYDEMDVLDWFADEKHIHMLGLYNIDNLIYSLDASKIGMDDLIEATTLIMESLTVHFSSCGYVNRLISYAMLARMFNVPKTLPEAEMNKEYEKYFYPYRKAVIESSDYSGYHFVNYALFLQNARYFHTKTGISHSYDEMTWEASNMSHWVSWLIHHDEESIDVLIGVCWVYCTYLRDPSIHDLITPKDYEDYKCSEYDSENPSKKAIHYRFTKTLAAVLHNPKSLIMKPKLKKQFREICEEYGDYLSSLSSVQYKRIKKYIDEL